MIGVEMIRKGASSGSVSTSLPSLWPDGHDPDAGYCKHCGNAL